MQEGRCTFNPIELRGLLYMCGRTSNSIETFDPETRHFLSLFPGLPESTPCILVVENDELLVVSWKSATRWCVKEEGLVQVWKGNHAAIRVDCNMAPVVDYINRVVYISQAGTCCSFNFEGSEFRQL